MTSGAQAEFDIDALKRAFEANDVETVLSFYADRLEHVEIDAGAPPNSPRTTDKDHLRGALEGAAAGGITLRMDKPFVGQDRAACTITCEMPDGKRLVSNTIFDLAEGKIVRQLDVQVMDPD
jgi:SnoaL-like domain